MARWNLFSNQNQKYPDVYVYDHLPMKLRNQIWWIWKDHFKSEEFPMFSIAYDAICTEYGLQYLVSKSGEVGHIAVVKYFLTDHGTNINPELDIIELTFGMMCATAGDTEKINDLVGELNHRFRDNGVGYEFVCPPGQLIRTDQTVLHQEVLRPALQLLIRPEYKNANDEFFAALEDYKNGNFEDVLTKAGAAYESLIKIIASKKGWTHNPKDASANLSKMFIQNAGMPGCFEHPLVGIATLRNALSSAHGQGTLTKTAEEHYARYFLYQVASAMLMLSQEAP